MWRQVVILGRHLWAVSTDKNICAVEKCGQMQMMQMKRDGIAGASACEGRRSFSWLQSAETEPKVDCFSLICTCRSGFPCKPSGSSCFAETLDVCALVVASSLLLPLQSEAHLDARSNEELKSSHVMSGRCCQFKRLGSKTKKSQIKSCNWK